MEQNKLQTYEEVLKSLKGKNRQKHLILGNGFSMAYDHEIFSYNALSKFIYDLDDDILQKLFSVVKTNNFELLMKQLDNFSQIAVIFGADEKVVNKIKDASQTLKESLINAVKELHPEHVFTIPEEKSKTCALFLNEFIAENGNVFTTNYDLLLYWVLMRNKFENKSDGFGREREDTNDFVPLEELEYSELRWGKNKGMQNIHYLHGALQLFDTGVDVIKEEYSHYDYILTNIKKRLDKKEYPIFVTAGNGREKLTHIMHNKYLSYCYDSFSSIFGSLIAFGFNFGEYDDHIIEAINKAAKFRTDKDGKPNKLFSIYIGVYSESDLKHIKSITVIRQKCNYVLFAM